MADILVPDVPVSQAAPRLIDATGRFVSPLSGTVRTVGRPGDRWAFALTYNTLNNRNSSISKARMEAFIASMRGAANRALYSPPDYLQRGSFPSSELISNNVFTLGTTGWQAAAAATISTIDREVYCSATANGSYGFRSLTGFPISLSQNVPYAFRAIVSNSNGCFNLNAFMSDSNSVSFQGQMSDVTSGLGVAIGVPTGTSAFVEVYDSASTNSAGAYFSCPFTSLSRCALVDSGVNLISWSDDGTQSGWVQNNATVTYGASGPDGSATASRLLETSATGSHYQSKAVTLDSAAGDYCLSAILKAGTRNWCYLQIVENTGSTGVTCFFNTSTGAIGTTTTGLNWSNVRVSAVSFGGGFWKFTIIGRKTNAATAGVIVIGAATADTTASYTGTASGNAFNYWRATFSESSFPSQLVHTGSAAVTGHVAGSVIPLKGLPASTNGLLLPGDWCEVNSELKKVTSSLNSDALGMGTLTVSPPVRSPLADNDPLIVNKPMGRFILKDSENGWTSSPGIFSDFAFDLIEAPQ